MNDFSITILDTMPADAFGIRDSGLSGAEERVVTSARVSTNKGLKGAQPDMRLLNYLWKHGHTSPFEQVVLTVEVVCDVATARQWMRHRTQSYNEISRRYTDVGVSIYTPQLRMQAEDNKQGSGALAPTKLARELEARINDHHEQTLALYRDLIEAGIANEVARSVLPVSLMTRFVATASWWNFWKFCSIRNHPDAQLEIRTLAEQLQAKLRGMMPHLEV